VSFFKTFEPFAAGRSEVENEKDEISVERQRAYIETS
jgi:hypothetical protein